MDIKVVDHLPTQRPGQRHILRAERVNGWSDCNNKPMLKVLGDKLGHSKHHCVILFNVRPQELPGLVIRLRAI
jgi:hypothetical protein